MTHYLSVYWDVDPVFFTLGSFKLGYYNLLFITGFAIGLFMVKGFFKRENIPPKIVESLTYTSFFAAVIGARLGHCFFYNPLHFLTHPVEIFMIWKGGLASHGGMIGLMIGVWIFVRKYGPRHGFNYMWLADRVAIPTILAAGCIRLGNLMNSEIYGVETSLPWGFIFARNGETLPKHPTQIYEALCYFAIFLLLLWLYRRFLPKLKTGVLLGLTFVFCFTARFVIEFIKNPQVEFEEGMKLDMGQWLSIPFILFGIGLTIWALKRGAPAMLPQKTKIQAAVHKENNRPGKKKRG
ncbi:MAG: prolipoprotein diacylglyceryl transferase [Bacteroidales bacterium]|nr:prolipoprotein diacylglyceryl transferase [Bacteroidales bacterium]